MKSWEELERDFGWKIVFAGDNNEFEFKTSKIYLKSTTHPNLHPPQISLGMCNFQVQLRKMFSDHPRLKLNLSKFQKRLLEKLQHEGETVLQMPTRI